MAGKEATPRSCNYSGAKASKRDEDAISLTDYDAGCKAAVWLLSATFVLMGLTGWWFA